MSLKNKDDITETIEATECNAGIQGKTIIVEDPKQYIYFAFEDLGKSDDFDFNDVVVRVSYPDANRKSTVELCAIGGTLQQWVYCGETLLGKEVHEYGAFGDNTKMNNLARRYMSMVPSETILRISLRCLLLC